HLGKRTEPRERGDLQVQVMRGDLNPDAALRRLPLGRSDNLEARCGRNLSRDNACTRCSPRFDELQETKDFALRGPAFSKGQKIRASRGAQPGKRRVDDDLISAKDSD